MDSLTQSEFGEHVGIGQSAVSSLVAAGIVDLEHGLTRSRLDYCRHLREVAAGRRAQYGGLDLAAERAGLAREQRERLAMQNAITRGELGPITLIEQVIAKAGSKIAGILDAIPGACRRRNAALTSDDLRTIADECARARNVAAAMSLADLDIDLGGDVDHGEATP